VVNRAREAWGPFIAPPSESSHWGVRNIDISGLGAGHVWHTFLETDLGTGYIRSGTLSLRNRVRSDLSGKCLWNPDKEEGPAMSG
jgi:hypothetical protein